MSKQIEKLLKNAVTDQFCCDGCGTPLEPDADQCGDCGWENPLVKGGYI